MIILGLIFSSVLSERDLIWSYKKIKSSPRIHICLHFLMENISLSMALELNLTINVTNFSFVLKLFCFVHNQVWSYKRRKGAMKVLPITWTLTVVVLNEKMLHSLIISWFRSKLWSKWTILGLGFSFLMSQMGVNQRGVSFSRALELTLR